MVHFRLLINILPAVLGSLVMILVVKSVDQYLPVGYKGIVLIILVGVLSYGGSIMFLNIKRLKQQVKIFLKYAKN